MEISGFTQARRLAAGCREHKHYSALPFKVSGFLRAAARTI
jgi:hypothetical protein